MGNTFAVLISTQMVDDLSFFFPFATHPVLTDDCM